MTEQNKKIVAFNLMKGLSLLMQSQSSLLMQSQSSLNHKLLRLVTINKTRVGKILIQRIEHQAPI